jgi:hypothetical protein
VKKKGGKTKEKGKNDVRSSTAIVRLGPSQKRKMF